MVVSTLDSQSLEFCLVGSMVGIYFFLNCYYFHVVTLLLNVS